MSMFHLTVLAVTIQLSGPVSFSLKGCQNRQSATLSSHLAYRVTSGKGFLNVRCDEYCSSKSKNFLQSPKAISASNNCLQVAKGPRRSPNMASKMGGGLVLARDGRSDSPGHAAKYGGFNTIKCGINKVIDIQVVQSNEVGSSARCKNAGLQWTYKFLKDAGLHIDTIITDRHKANEITIQMILKRNKIILMSGMLPNWSQRS